MKTVTLTAAALALAAVAGHAPAANLVTNGSFAGGSPAGWSASPTNFTGAPYNEATTDPVRCQGAASCAVLNDYPNTLVSMSQTITGLTVGDSYTLTWDMASSYGCCGSTITPGAGGGIDGHTWLFAIGNNTQWQTYRETFVYTGGSNALTFYAQANGTDTDAAFTNISLSPAPEPAGWALMLLGVGALGVALRRTRTVAA